jgi:hypothetical protein
MGDRHQERHAIAEHERRLTRALLEDLKPKVLVTPGRAALRELTALLPFNDALPDSLEKALGLTFRADIEGASVLVCPAKHFSYPMKAETQSQVGRQIGAALNRSIG